MKPIAFLLGTLAAPLFGAPVVELTLDPRSVIELPVSREVTTLTLPGPVSAVVGSDLVLDAGRGADLDSPSTARFHVTHIPSAPFVHVRALTGTGASRLTVLFEHRAYVLHLRAVSADSVASVIFNRPIAPEPEKPSRMSHTTRSSPKAAQALLDRARALPLLAKSLPQALESVVSKVENRSIPHPDLEIRLQEVVRFRAEDALVFLLLLENRTTGIVGIDPSSFAARVGDQRFVQTVANSPRVIRPGEKVAAEFAVVGATDGSRQDIALENVFSIEVATQRLVALQEES